MSKHNERLVTGSKIEFINATLESIKPVIRITIGANGDSFWGLYNSYHSHIEALRDESIGGVDTFLRRGIKHTGTERRVLVYSAPRRSFGYDIKLGVIIEPTQLAIMSLSSGSDDYTNYVEKLKNAELWESEK